MNSSPLSAREIEALTFVYTPTPRSERDLSPEAGGAGRSMARPLVGAAVALVVFVALAWILTPL